jgi:hypothetical protein
MIKSAYLIGFEIVPILDRHSEGVAVKGQDLIEVVKTNQTARFIEIEKMVNPENGMVTTKVTVEINLDDPLNSKKYTFTGTDEEVCEQVNAFKENV